MNGNVNGSTEEIVVDGLTVEEHRMLGGDILDVMCALGMLEEGAANEGRAAAYRRMAYIVDGMLADLADVYIDGYYGITGRHPDGDGAYPYPRFHCAQEGCDGNSDGGRTAPADVEDSSDD